MMGVTAAQVGVNSVSNETERRVEGDVQEGVCIESCMSGAAEPL